MYKKIILFFSLIFSSSYLWSQSSPNTLDVVSWNIEWFGSTGNGPSDLNLQEQNVIKVLKYLKADVYGICEVVDTMRFRRVVDSLGSNYAYQIADFCSSATTGSGGAWLAGQKLAFIYDKTYVKNVSFRGFMRSSATASSNWATGRFPYLMNADVTINGITKNINFFVIHGKSGSTSSDYTRRKAGAQEMKDSLDATFTNKFNLIIGDYNDDLYQTICSGCGTNITSYDPIVKDSTNYKSITLPLSKAGQTSEIGYLSVIDNHIASTTGYTHYMSNSAQIRKDATDLIANYATNNTSDHYPVFSQYNFAQTTPPSSGGGSGGVTTAIVTVNAADAGIYLLENPVHQSVVLQFKNSLQQVTISLVDVFGRRINLMNKKLIAANEIVSFDIANYNSGFYFIAVQTPTLNTALKVFKY